MAFATDPSCSGPWSSASFEVISSSDIYCNCVSGIVETRLTNGLAYVVAIVFLASGPVKYVVYLVHRHHLRVAKHRLVDGSWVDHGLDNKLAYISGVGESREDFAVAWNRTRQLTVSNVVERGRERKLEPPADVNDGVRKSEALHVIENVLFL